MSATGERRRQDSVFDGHELELQGLETGPGMSVAACRAAWQLTMLPWKHQ